MALFEDKFVFFAYDLYDIAVVVKCVFESFHNRTDVTRMWSVVTKVFSCMRNPICISCIRDKQLKSINIRFEIFRFNGRDIRVLHPRKADHFSEPKTFFLLLQPSFAIFYDFMFRVCYKFTYFTVKMI